MDSLRWSPCASGNFSIQSTWDSCRVRKEKVEWGQLVNFPHSIPRYSFVLWMAIREQLSTKDRLLRYGGISDGRCLFCNQAVETHSHLFFQCSFTSSLWRHLITDCGMNWLMGDW
uniref:Reverse transcriptase zinc-binding domain-containing protein n=1 Tax=Davidia involucrata TaxID=16924 RepID=A0A5B7BV48_DAVIN